MVVNRLTNEDYKILKRIEKTDTRLNWSLELWWRVTLTMTQTLGAGTSGHMQRKGSWRKGVQVAPFREPGRHAAAWEQEWDQQTRQDRHQCSPLLWHLTLNSNTKYWSSCTQILSTKLSPVTNVEDCNVPHDHKRQSRKRTSHQDWLQEHGWLWKQLWYRN